jgi:hypothetical protein
VKIKKNTFFKKVKDKLLEIDTLVLVDIFSDLISESVLKSFKKFLPASFSGPYQNGIGYLINKVLLEESGWDDILHQLSKMNASYIENSNYLSLSQEQLKAEFEKSFVPSLHGTGLTPEMLIFYHYSKYDFNNKNLPFLIEEWKREDDLMRREKIVEKHVIQFQPPLAGSQTEFEINQFAEENKLRNLFSHEEIDFIAKSFNGTYNKEEKTITLKRGIVYYFYLKLKDLVDAEHWYDNALRLMYKEIITFNKNVNRLLEIRKERDVLFDENSKLRKKVKYLEKEKATLVAVQNSNKHSDLEKENTELRKKLAYAMNRVEQLESQIASLEEAKKINEEIVENLPLVIPSAAVEMPNYGFVVVSGGKWNSSSKDDVEKFFNEYSIEIEFVTAEDTLKKQDRLSNADLIIFDSSRHSHKYYYKIKELNQNIMHIRKSNLEEIKKLFTESTVKE